MPEVIGASKGAIGLAPYGDQTEHTGPPEVIVIPDTYRPFFATDARSVLITLFPQHYNFIPNPAFRVDTAGWEISAQPAANAYSWTFATDADNTITVGRLNAILAGSSDPAVAPNPGDVYAEAAYVPADLEGQRVWVSDVDVWLVLEETSTLTVADAAAVGLDLSADVSGYRLWDPSTDAVVPDDAWVGQSLRFNQSGSMRYREDTNKFVYVGPRGDAGTPYEMGRSGSGEWTFSTYVKGSGRVRLRLDGYLPESWETTPSTPEYQNLPTVADPTVEPIGDPFVLGPEGDVWQLLDPPYYTTLGAILESAVDPSTTDLSTVMPPLAQSPDGSLWEYNSGATETPYYTEWGVPTTLDVIQDPLTEPAGDKYIKAAGDGGNVVWTLIDPTPGAAPYYERVAVVPLADPETARPVFSEYLMYSGDLWGLISPMPSAAPFYELLGTPAVSSDIAVEPPGSTYIIDAAGVVAVLDGPPYYESLDRGPAAASVTGDWIDVENDGEWHRVVVTSDVRAEEKFGVVDTPSAFTACWWLDAQIEWDNAENLHVSAVMLDPHEYPECAYFDGDMTEDPLLNDFLWSGDANASISEYYFDRQIRTRWLYERMGFVVPAGRPFQIFFGSYDRPYIPPSE